MVNIRLKYSYSKLLLSFLAFLRKLVNKPEYTNKSFENVFKIVWAEGVYPCESDYFFSGKLIATLNKYMDKLIIKISCYAID